MLTRSTFVGHCLRRYFSIRNSKLYQCFEAKVQDQRIVEICEKNGNTLKFPGVWLRDNCQCESCFHYESQSRKIDWSKFNPNVKVLSAVADKSADRINIKWDDDHCSTFDLSWLKARSFSDDNRNRHLREFYRPPAKHWNKTKFEEIVNNFDYNEVIQKNEVLKAWLEALAIYGVAIIKNAPLEKTIVRKLADRVGFIRRTTYGEEFIVQAKPGATNYAYMSHPLPLHTDLPYYEYKPSVNILHCLVQSKSKGGDNLLADGFFAADRMKNEFPDDFKILTETIVDWNDIGSEGENSFHNIWRAPVICLDKSGNYARMNHSIPQRDSHFSVNIESVLPWYEAYAKFVKILQDEAVSFKTKPGNILTFNNIRLVHGRTGYDDSEENIRYIVGAYLDWDIIYSKLRVLKKLKTNFEEK